MPQIHTIPVRFISDIVIYIFYCIAVLKSISVVPLQKLAANGTDVYLECRVELQGPAMINWTRQEENIRNVAVSDFLHSSH